MNSGTSPNRKAQEPEKRIQPPSPFALTQPLISYSILASFPAEDLIDTRAIPSRGIVILAQTHTKSKTPSLPSSNTFLPPYTNFPFAIGDIDPNIIPPDHLFFLVPSAASPDQDTGLPPAEAEKLRRQLLLWMLKQREVLNRAQELHSWVVQSQPDAQ